jgi:16S rRNA (uracil1498-N3)-methyltransferase
MGQQKIRLCVDQPLHAGQSLGMSEGQAHYLFSVMRLGGGSEVLLFNGRDGEWAARVDPAGRKGGTALCLHQTQTQAQAPDIWLVFAPVKKARTDFIVEKAVELGAARLLPVQTDFTNAERLRRDKAAAHIREAAEQCGALWLPEVDDLVPLARLLDRWDPERRLIWADESAAGASLRPCAQIAGHASGPIAVLVGPEGGFSERERARLRGLPFVTPVTLGPRILRAETAALALMALCQATRGDW